MIREEAVLGFRARDFRSLSRSEYFANCPFVKPYPRWLALISFTLGGAAFGAPPAPVTWTLQDPPHVGGIATTVWGAPQVMPDGSLHFDGKQDGLLLPVNPVAGLAQFTVAMLFRPASDAPFAQRFFCIDDEGGERLTLESRVVPGKGWYLDTFLQAATSPASAHRALIDPTKLHPLDQWVWAELSYDGHTMTAWVDGVQELNGDIAFHPMVAGKTSVGVRLNRVFWFKGEIKEVRFYPAALAPADLPRVP
jgi:hypothetical protein